MPRTGGLPLAHVGFKLWAYGLRPTSFRDMYLDYARGLTATVCTAREILTSADALTPGATIGPPQSMCLQLEAAQPQQAPQGGGGGLGRAHPQHLSDGAALGGGGGL
jgi:hypothetical protein